MYLFCWEIAQFQEQKELDQQQQLSQVEITEGGNGTTLPAIKSNPSSRARSRQTKSRLESHPVEDLPSYCKPLTKQKVFELTHHDQTYASKWLRMKQIRDNRFSQRDKKREQNTMMHALKKTVISSDRMALDAAHAATSLAIRADREGMYNRNKQNEDMSSWRRAVYFKQELLRKEMQALDMKRALNVAVGRVEEEREVDRLEKAYFKPNSSIGPLNGDTSYRVEMSSEVLERIQNAKRYSEFCAAKKQAEQIYERTLSERIARYTQARAHAIAKATSAGAPVVINTLFGDMLFAPHSESPMAGIAATMSLAYSSAQSSELLHGGSSLSPPGSPSVYNIGESNTFLKELAEKEYLARKHIYYDHEMDGIDRVSDELSEGDVSWRTDPRVAHL